MNPGSSSTVAGRSRSRSCCGIGRCCGPSPVNASPLPVGRHAAAGFSLQLQSPLSSSGSSACSAAAAGHGGAAAVAAAGGVGAWPRPPLPGRPLRLLASSSSSSSTRVQGYRQRSSSSSSSSGGGGGGGGGSSRGGRSGSGRGRGRGGGRGSQRRPDQLQQQTGLGLSPQQQQQQPADASARRQQPSPAAATGVAAAAAAAGAQRQRQRSVKPAAAPPDDDDDASDADDDDDEGDEGEADGLLRLPAAAFRQGRSSSTTSAEAAEAEARFTSLLADIDDDDDVEGDGASAAALSSLLNELEADERAAAQPNWEAGEEAAWEAEAAGTAAGQGPAAGNAATAVLEQQQQQQLSERDRRLLRQLLRYLGRCEEWQQRRAAADAAAAASGGYRDPRDGPGVYRAADGSVDWERTRLSMPPEVEWTPEEEEQAEQERTADWVEAWLSGLVAEGWFDPAAGDAFDLARAAAGLSLPLDSSSSSSSGAAGGGGGGAGGGNNSDSLLAEAAGDPAAGDAAAVAGPWGHQPQRGEFEEPRWQGIESMVEPRPDGWMGLGVPGGRQLRLKRGSVARQSMLEAAAALKAAEAKGFGGSSSSKGPASSSSSSSNSSSKGSPRKGQKGRRQRSGDDGSGGPDDNSTAALVKEFRESSWVEYDDAEEAAAAAAASDELAAAAAADDEVDQLQLAALRQQMADAGPDWGAAGAGAAGGGSSEVWRRLLAARELPQLSELLLQLLPPRVRGEPLAAAWWARQQEEEQEEQQQTQTQPEAPPSSSSSSSSRAAASGQQLQQQRRPLAASELVLAAVCWTAAAKSLPAKQRLPWGLHEALQVLVEATAEAAAGAGPTAAGQQQQRQHFFSDVQAAVLLRALVSAGTPLPQTLLTTLLQQLTAAPGGSSGISGGDSGGSFVCSRLPPLVGSGLVWALGGLNEKMQSGFVPALAPQLFEAMCQCLEAFGLPPSALAAWTPLDLAAAAAGFSKLAHQPPGRFLHHASRQLLNNNLLSVTPTSCLVLLARHVGLLAAAAAAASGRSSNAFGSSSAGGGGGAVLLPLDLLDGIARELEARLSLQLTECQESLSGLLTQKAAAGTASGEQLPRRARISLAADLRQQLEAVQERQQLLNQAAAAAAGGGAGAGGSLGVAGDEQSPGGAAAVVMQWRQQQIQLHQHQLLQQMRRQLAHRQQQLMQQLAQVQASLAPRTTQQIQQPLQQQQQPQQLPGQQQQRQQRRQRPADPTRDADIPGVAYWSAGAAGGTRSGVGAALPEQLYVAAGDAAVVTWALGTAEYKCDAFLAAAVAVYGDLWHQLLPPDEVLLLLAGLAGLGASGSSNKPTHLIIRCLEMFEEGGPSRWMPLALHPQSLDALTSAAVALDQVPGEAVTWGWLRAAAAVFELHRPDEAASQVLTLSMMGYTHSTFLAMAAESAGQLLPACRPRGLADLALGFSGYRLESRGLHQGLVEEAARQLGRFNEYDLARLLRGLAAREDPDWAPLLAAAEDLLLPDSSSSSRPDWAGPAVPFAGGTSLACLHLLQILPLCRDSSAAGSVRRAALVDVLLSGVSRIIMLLPADELYGLLQGLASVGGGHAIRDQHLLQQLASAACIRAPELSAAALIDTAAALFQLVTAAAAAAAGGATADADDSSSSSDSSSQAVAAAAVRSELQQLLQQLVCRVEQGCLGALLSPSGVVSLSSLARSAAYPARFLQLLTALLLPTPDATTAAAAGPEAGTGGPANGQTAAAAAAAAGDRALPGLPGLDAAATAAAIEAAAAAAQVALPNTAPGDVAALLVGLARLTVVPGALTMTAAAELPLLVELSLRELSSSRGRAAFAAAAAAGGSGGAAGADAGAGGVLSVEAVVAACQQLGLQEQQVRERLTA